MKVAVLGCGPTGLFAAHAAKTAGHDVAVFSKPRQSRMNGAQYLHKPIPGLQSKYPFEISYELIGEAAVYQKKVYGAMELGAPSSAEELVGRAPAWDIRTAYDHAWAVYGPDVVEWDASEPLPTANLVISTIPRPLLCRRNHAFTSQEVWATDTVVYPTTLRDEDDDDRDDVVVLSGKPVDRWYRQSRIQGHENTEWPIDVFSSEDSLRFAGRRLWRVTKPLTTDCDCNPTVLHVGRYGEWRKGILAHSGYYDVAKFLGLPTPRAAALR